MSSRDVPIDIKTSAAASPGESGGGAGSGALLSTPLRPHSLERSTSAESYSEPHTPDPLLPGERVINSSTGSSGGGRIDAESILLSPIPIAASPASLGPGPSHASPLGGNHTAPPLSSFHASAATAIDMPYDMDGFDGQPIVGGGGGGSGGGRLQCCECWKRLPFQFRVLLVQVMALGFFLLVTILAFIFDETVLGVTTAVAAVFVLLTIIVHRMMLRIRAAQRYHALPQQAGGGAIGGRSGGRNGRIHPLALRHMQRQQMSAFAASAMGVAGMGGGAGPLYDDLLASTISQNAYALDPDTLTQLALINPRLGRQLGGTHMRLSMMDRDFTANDYETLCSLDEESRANSGGITGIPQSQIERMPVVTVPQPKTTTATTTGSAVATPAPVPVVATASGGTSAPPPVPPTTTKASGIVITSSADTNASVPTAMGGASAAAAAAAAATSEVHKCAICLEPTQPGEQLRVLLCMHRFHVSCVDRWLRRKAACPTCLFDHKQL